MEFFEPVDLLWLDDEMRFKVHSKMYDMCHTQRKHQKWLDWLLKRRNVSFTVKQEHSFKLLEFFAPFLHNFYELKACLTISPVHSKYDTYCTFSRAVCFLLIDWNSANLDNLKEETFCFMLASFVMSHEFLDFVYAPRTDCIAANASYVLAL